MLSVCKKNLFFFDPNVHVLSIFICLGKLSEIFDQYRSYRAFSVFGNRLTFIVKVVNTKNSFGSYIYSDLQQRIRDFTPGLKLHTL